MNLSAAESGPPPEESGWTDFEEFAAHCGPRLLRTAWMLTGDRHHAEELLRTALARSWPKWRRISDDRPETYVRGVLVRVHVRRWRRRRRGEVPYARTPRAALPGDRYREADPDDALRRALRRLPPWQRAVIALRYLEGMGVEETASLLNCSAGTVRRRTAKALRALSGALPGAGLPRG
ncbi:SigE family RNA polymerase sigma factor [Actinacidiphila glaucinigra]|uniref:SigE family RNA polymerase sigma factor n=1 Tax=Actinacidiphila glaucinigra TaxID=235986 RepID=UPI0035E1734B